MYLSRHTPHSQPLSTLTCLHLSLYFKQTNQAQCTHARQHTPFTRRNCETHTYTHRLVMSTYPPTSCRKLHCRKLHCGCAAPLTKQPTKARTHSQEDCSTHRLLHTQEHTADQHQDHNTLCATLTAFPLLLLLRQPPQHLLLLRPATATNCQLRLPDAITASATRQHPALLPHTTTAAANTQHHPTHAHYALPVLPHVHMWWRCCYINTPISSERYICVDR